MHHNLISLVYSVHRTDGKGHSTASTQLSFTAAVGGGVGGVIVALVVGVVIVVLCTVMVKRRLKERQNTERNNNLSFRNEIYELGELRSSYTSEKSRHITL